MYVSFELEIDKGEDTFIIIIIRREEHLHSWHIYERILTTRGQRKIVPIPSSTNVKHP